jgi:hypothetical protein
MKAAGTAHHGRARGSRTDLAERWVREWALQPGGCAADRRRGRRRWCRGRALHAHARGERPCFATPITRRTGWACSTACRRRCARKSRCRESFRTGVGHDYDSHGPEGAVGIERSFEPWNRAFLLPVVLPALDGVVRAAAGRCSRRRRRLRCGERGAADGAGVPATSTFTGYDISQFALGRAEEKLAASRAGERRVPRPASVEALPSEPHPRLSSPRSTASTT